MARIYLAAPWAQRHAAQIARTQLEAAGHTVPCRWLDVADGADSVLEAQHDVEDLRACEVLVVLNLAMSEGKACETGMALALCMPVISVGDGANIFLTLPEVIRVRTLAEAISALTMMTRIEHLCPQN